MDQTEMSIAWTEETNNVWYQKRYALRSGPEVYMKTRTVAIIQQSGAKNNERIVQATYFVVH